MRRDNFNQIQPVLRWKIQNDVGQLVMSTLFRCSVVLLFSLCLHAVAIAHPLDGRCEIPPVDLIPPQGEASIQVEIPALGSTVYSEWIEVIVKVEKVDLSAGAHWDVYMDDDWQGEVRDRGAALAVTLGQHRICVVLYDESGSEILLHDGVVVQVKAATERYTTIQPRYPVPRRDDTPLNLLPAIAALAAASVGGWWLGRRLGRR